MARARTSLTSVLDEKPKNIKRVVRQHARAPATDQLTLGICAAALNQFRLPQREPIPMPEWSLEHAVVPEAFVELLNGFEATPPDATESASQPTVSFSGRGDMNTPPFELARGDYEVALEQRGDCAVGGWFLRRTEGDRGVESFDKSGYVYSVEGGRHYWKVITVDDCRRTVTVQPL